MKSSRKKKRGAQSDTIKGGALDSVSPPPSLPAKSGDAATPKRDPKTGQFIKGFSGNPIGRVKGSKNYLVELRRNTEIAMRDYLADEAHQKLAFQAIDRLFEICVDGEEKNAVGALKLLMDKLMVSPRPEEETSTGPKHVTVVIENKTGRDQPPIQVITDADYEEISPDG